SLLVKNEEVGSMGGPIGLRDRLRRVAEVWKVETLGLGARAHPLEAVFRVVPVVVRIDGDELHSTVSIVPLGGDHPIFVSLDIRAAVATEDNHDDQYVGERI